MLQLPLLLIRFWILGMYHPCIKIMGAVRQMGVKVQGFCQPVIPSHPKSSHRSDGYRQGTSPARQKLASEVSRSSPANAKLSALLTVPFGHSLLHLFPILFQPAVMLPSLIRDGNPGLFIRKTHLWEQQGANPKKHVSSCFEPCLYPIFRLWMAETHGTPPDI